MAFFLLLAAGKAAEPQHLLGIGLFTATIGILFLFILQIVADWSQGVWIHGGGIVALIFYFIKLIGFSYQADKSGDTVIRGGRGIYYSHLSANLAGDLSQGPYAISTTSTNAISNGAPLFNFANPFNVSGSSGLLNLTAMSDNLRPVTYGARYEAFLPARAAAPRPFVVSVAGKHCEQGDILIKDAHLPAELAVGDVLATPVTGAYSYSMASNYNLLPRPAVVFIRDGSARVVVRRETFEDLVARDHMGD